MMHKPGPGSPKKRSKVNETFHELQVQLTRVLQTVPPPVSPSQRFDDLIPCDERRRVWHELHEAGVDLPDLRLSSRVFMLFAFLVLVPVALLSFICHWNIALCLLELGAIARKAARPWATYPPYGCETLHEAALHLTPFSRADYQKGLWSRDEIEGKVRLILCQCAGIPFESIHGTTRIADIC